MIKQKLQGFGFSRSTFNKTFAMIYILLLFLAQLHQLCYTLSAPNANILESAIMKASTQRLLSVVFLFFTLGIVLYFGFSNNDITALWGALRKLSPVYLLYCFLGWCGYVLMDALSVYYFLLKQNYPITFLGSIYVAITGIFYSNITPGASGGQPMQLFRLNQMKVPLGVGGSALMVKFFCFQLMLLVVGAVLWLTHWDFVFAQTNGVIWLILLGYLINSLSIGIVLIMAVSQGAMRFIISLCIRIGVKFHICKNPQKSAAKWEAHCDSLLQSVQLIRRRPLELISQFGIALLQLLCLMSVILALYHAFGLTGVTTMELLTMGVLLYITASYTPLPGASGAQEGGFALYFAGIFPDASLFVALLLWRFFTYYLSILAGAGMNLWESIRGLIRKRPSHQQTSE